MRRFAALYARLDATTSTHGKLRALQDYFAGAPAADAAWAVYFLSGGKPGRLVPTRTLRALACRVSGTPEWLFEESYQAVGDLAETIAHLLPDNAAAPGVDRTFAAWVEERLLPLRDLRDDALDDALCEAWRELDAQGRFVWNKLITGGMRVGVSRLLVTRAIGAVAGIDPRLVAERLMGDWQPTAERFRALLAECPVEARPGRPYPFFLAHPIDRAPAGLGPVAAWHAEWKWDGIRAQLVRRAGQAWLWSRGDELVTDRFPEIAGLAQRLLDGTVIDGEVLAWRDGRPMPFAVLQQRIGRKRLTGRVIAEAPVVLVAYDLLEARGEDQRSLPFAVRRERLERIVAAADAPELLLSPVVTAPDWETLGALRAQSRARGVEGLMLKRRDSPYGAGRVRLSPEGDWWKWKIDPLSVDAVLVYAQRGHGRRAGLYTDYTFAVRKGEELVPFAKAYSGLTDAEIREVDAFIRRNTREKFGPVRSVTPTLVMEIGFEGIQRSPRHRSGIAVRFPRILRLRPDKRPDEADTLDALERLLASAADPDARS